MKATVEWCVVVETIAVRWSLGYKSEALAWMGMLPPNGLLEKSPQKSGPMWMATGLQRTVRPVKSRPYQG